MAQALQHQATAFGPWLQTAGTRNHRPDGPKADHAITINMDQSMGADHRCGTIDQPLDWLLQWPPTHAAVAGRTPM